MCDGLTGADWKYQHHTSFELNADYMAEYVLHVNDNQVKIITCYGLREIG